MSDGHNCADSLMFVLWEALAGHSQNATFLDDEALGIVGILDELSAEEASSKVAGYSVATHARHLLHSFLAYTQAISCDEPDAISEKWPEWENLKVNAEEWLQLRNELRKNAASLLGMLKQKSDYAGRERDFALGSLAHTAFHLGVIQVKYDLLKNSK